MQPFPSALPVARRERKKLATRARVLAEARRLLAAQGWGATSIEEIAAAADVAPATFFNYFPSKDDLLAALAGDVFSGLQQLIDRAPAPGASVQAGLASALAEAAPLVESARAALGPLLLRVVRQSAARREADTAALVSAFSRLFVFGQARGEVRRDVEASFLAELACAALLAALGHWLNDPRYPLDARLCQVAAVIGDGLRPLPEPETRRTP